MGNPKAERLLNLLAALTDTPRFQTAEELIGSISGYPPDPDSARRAFERDKAELRREGIPIISEPVVRGTGSVEAYRIERESIELPDPGLTPEEVAALRLAAGAVQIPGLEQAELRTLMVRVVGETAAEVSDRAELAEARHFDRWSDAVMDRCEVTFEYASNSGEVASRRLQPARLDHRLGRWYVAGWDPDRDAERQFRLGNVVGEPRLGPPGAFEARAVQAHRRLHGWELGDGPAVTARVWFDATVAGLLGAELPDAPIEAGPDGSVVVTFEVRSLDKLITYVLGHLDHAELLEPPEFRAALIERLEAML